MWRVKSKTGKIIHLTDDRISTLCGNKIKDTWSFLYFLKSREEAAEMIDGLCSRCNEININLLTKVKEEIKDERKVSSKRAAPASTTRGARPVKTTGLGTWSVSKD